MEHMMKELNQLARVYELALVEKTRVEVKYSQMEEELEQKQSELKRLNKIEEEFPILRKVNTLYDVLLQYDYNVLYSDSFCVYCMYVFICR
jgi:hypothetical protein